MDLELCYLTAQDLVAGYAAGKFSPVEVTNAVFARIADKDSLINAYCYLDREGALKAAQVSETRWRSGTPCGAIDGVPTSVKDLHDVAGWPTGRGSLTGDPAAPVADDSPVVARLRDAGAVLIGKTTTPEFGWKGVTDCPLTGATRNPWNTELTPGGSSGGASAALAAGMCQLATGSDGGGSIRIPSGFTGVVGIKPTFGRVAAYPPSAYGTVSHVGPMARTVADTALMLNVISGPDPRDWLALPADGQDNLAGLEDGVAGLKCAFSPDLGHATVHPQIAKRVAAAVAVLAELGAEVEEVDPEIGNSHDIFHLHWAAGCASATASLDESERAKLDPGFSDLAQVGSRIPIDDYMAATRDRGAMAVTMSRFLDRYDLLLTPTLAVPAFPVNRLEPDKRSGGDWTAWPPFSYPINLTQQPALSVPCGFTDDGLPVGLQIVAGKYREPLALRAARAYEAAHPYTDRRPPL